MIGYDNENVLISYIKPQFNSLNYNQILLDSICDTYFVMNLKIPDTETELNSDYEKRKEENIKDLIIQFAGNPNMSEDAFKEEIEKVQKSNYQSGQQNYFLVLFFHHWDSFETIHLECF